MCLQLVLNSQACHMHTNFNPLAICSTTQRSTQQHTKHRDLYNTSCTPHHKRTLREMASLSWRSETLLYSWEQHFCLVHSLEEPNSILATLWKPHHIFWQVFWEGWDRVVPRNDYLGVLQQTDRAEIIEWAATSHRPHKPGKSNYVNIINRRRVQ